MPGAAQVAERAGVGLRTVFRHFEEMEILYREMAEVTAAAIKPLLDEPFAKSAWQDQLRELIDRRIRIHEEIMPLKIAASVLRFRSAFLMRDYRNHLRLERETLKAVIPGSLRRDQTLFNAVEMVTSFQAWRRLRQDQMLAVAEARRVLLRLLEAVLETAKI